MKKAAFILLITIVIFLIGYIIYGSYQLVKVTEINVTNLPTSETSTFGQNTAPANEVIYALSENSNEFDAHFNELSNLVASTAEVDWSYLKVPVYLQLSSYDQKYDLINVEFLGPSNFPRFEEHTASISLKCNPYYVFAAKYDKNKYSSLKEAEDYSIEHISFDEDSFKKLLFELNVSKAKDIKVTTYCLDENCKSFGNSCIFEGINN